ncbi:MAG: CvpA family protein [Firmicutes bacterium]|nr:CvpA family protein [Bacillota bacterium]
MELINGIDIAVILLIGLFAVAGIYKGFINTCFGFLPMAASLFAANKLYPAVSKFLRGTSFYMKLAEKVSESLDISGAVENIARQGETNIIESLNLPEFFKNSIIENNNPVVYDILGAGNLQEYIAKFVANICINVISIIAVYLAVYFAVKVLLSALNLVASLPGISFLNKSGGAAVGMIEGIIVTWIMGIVVVFFYSNANFHGFFESLEKSTVAKFLYENNLLLFMILKIFS